MKKPRPVFLTIHNAGTRKFPRFCISDQYLRYWTGDGWDLNRNKAELYANSDIAGATTQWILLLDFKNKPVRHFVAPVYIDLYADQEANITAEQLSQWISKVGKFLMDSEKHGNGPMQGALGLCRIELAELKEIQPKE